MASTTEETLAAFTMNDAREQHLWSLLHAVHLRMIANYRRGQEEHGFDLWEKPGLLEAVIDGAINQLVYLLTLRQQIEARVEALDNAEAGRGLESGFPR